VDTQSGRPHHIHADLRPLRFYVDELARQIRDLGEVSLRALLAHFEPERTRESLVGSFCALLELVKLGLVTVDQEGPRGDIVLRLRPEHATDLESVVRASLFDDEIVEEPAAKPVAAEAGHRNGSPEVEP
jgi:chromatin segregation and condensation protein Rec8/ScpA/Scc1 (kleisin family)